MNYKLIIKLTVTLCAAFIAVGAQTQNKKPNIVLIVSDDFGYGDAGVYGGGPGRGMPTPNLDRIADEGLTFFTRRTSPESGTWEKRITRYLMPMVLT